jgi:hypothetical protein
VTYAVEANRSETWKRLRGKAWLNYVMQSQSWGWPELNAAIDIHQSRSGLTRRWQNGDCCPSRLSVGKLQSSVPGSLELFDNPVWNLLRPRDISAKQACQAIEEYHSGLAEYSVYRFPIPHSASGMRSSIVPRHPHDSEALYRRADIHAFAIAIGLVRWAEAERIDEVHAYHLGNAYRMLPAVARAFYLKDCFAELSDALRALHARLDYSATRVSVDWPLLRRQFDSEHFDTTITRRGRTSLNDDYGIHSDPVIL